MLEYNIAIVVILGIVLLIAIISTVKNHRKKTNSNQETCISCRGMGFIPTYTSKPIPPCKRCNGTGYVDRK
ncbi:hypothetical protein C5F49_02230 [Nitrosopumilus oxyclinae]|uniref:Uncharacterized protein n=1 Tax=Nitrosopumilus oxyclinae TaxID=1959104 RepID=A0A7D5RA20_9ARCH|nr:hypothetical protein [Nitrosopumilus oxyclinae]QLH04261.1 hypothetical protein C5F49_02230 [Nitrosopumilus oxyclinae]